MAGGPIGSPGGLARALGDPRHVQRLLVPYRLRGVRTGVLAQTATVVALALVPLIGVPAHWSLAWYWGLLSIALVIGLAVRLFPWRRLLPDSPRGLVPLYAWSIGDVVLVLGLVAVTGGGDSPLWALLVLTTMLFASTYPRRAHAVLLAITVTGYIATLALVGDLRLDGTLLVRLLVLVVLAAMVAMQSRELVRQMLAHERASEASEERAAALARVDQLKTDFVANTSHELRTPTSVIYGLARTLVARWEHLDDERRRWFAQHLEVAARTLRDTVVILLDFGRMESGRLIPRQDPVDLPALVQRTVRGLAHHLTDHHVHLDIDPVPPLAADTELLERAVEHLVVNAATHTPPGTHIRVTVRPVEDSVVFTVSDDGPGIPPDELDLVTHPFTRGGDPLTRPTRGLGIGLAMVSEIASVHGGTLIVRSPSEGGAIFRLHLPLEPTPEAHAPGHPRSRSSPSRPDRGGGWPARS